MNTKLESSNENDFLANQIRTQIKEINKDLPCWWLVSTSETSIHLIEYRNTIDHAWNRDLLQRWWQQNLKQMLNNFLWLGKQNLPMALIKGLHQKTISFRNRSEQQHLKQYHCVLLKLDTNEIQNIWLILCYPRLNDFTIKNAQQLVLQINENYLEWFQNQKKLIENIDREPQSKTMSSDNIARLTHDFRKPLSNLILNHQNLFHLIDSSEQSMAENPLVFKEALKRFGKQLKMLETFTHDLLFLTTGNTPEEIDSVTFNLENLIDEICHNLDESHGRFKTIHIQKKYSKDNSCHQNKFYTNRILFNLLENAYKFCSTPGLIYIEIHKKGLWTRISIEDNGSGFLMQDNSFELSRKNINRKGGGWGLGLASANDLTEKIGGKLLHQKPSHGKGANFLLVLPNHL